MGYSGLLDIGDKNFPVPLSDYDYYEETNALRLNVDESPLETAPGFDNTWSDLTDPSYDVAINNFWRELDPFFSEAIVNPGVRAVSGSTVRASNLLGRTVFLARAIYYCSAQ